MPEPEDGMMVCSRTGVVGFRESEHMFDTCTVVHHRGDFEEKKDQEGDLLQQVVLIVLMISMNILTDNAKPYSSLSLSMCLIN